MRSGKIVAKEKEKTCIDEMIEKLNGICEVVLTKHNKLVFRIQVILGKILEFPNLTRQVGKNGQDHPASFAPGLSRVRKTLQELCNDLSSPLKKSDSNGEVFGVSPVGP